MIGLLILIGCTGELPAVTRSELPMEDVLVTLGRESEWVQLRLAGASMDEDGEGGHGKQAIAEVSGTPPLEIRGERSSWSLKEGTVVFEGDVVANRADVRLTCARLEVHYVDDKVSSAVATGGVEVRQGTRVAVGSRAHLTGAAGRIVLTGNARVDDGPHRLVGEPITLFLDEERVECESCTLVIAGTAVSPEPR
jgi:lipopolysaccharide transport protein LptA